MARFYSYGYYSNSTNKYSSHKYGAGFLYGAEIPPPLPSSLRLYGYTYVAGVTPTITWVNPPLTWDLTYTTWDGDALQYQLQFSFGNDDFDTPLFTTSSFSADTLVYTLAPEYTLTDQGVYYIRMRCFDGETWSNWSASTSFNLYTTAPAPPTIDAVTDPATGFWQTVTGIKATGLYVYIRNNNGEWAEVTYTNGISGGIWEYNMSLSPGANMLEAISAIMQDTDDIVSTPVFATINLISLIPDVYDVWNYFDEIGLLLSLSRVRGENNADYKARLFDVYQNPANATLSGLANGIARELGVEIADISIEKLSDLMDPSYPGNLLNNEGHAINTKLEDYANEVYDNNPIFWGNIVSDESYWDGADEEGSGYEYLPHIFDPNASGIYPKWQHAGIGDDDDLRVDGPVAHWNHNNKDDSWFLHIHSGYFYSAYPSGVINV